MIDKTQFEKRSNQLFESCRTRYRKVLQKGMPKGVALDIKLDAVLPFTRREFQQWLWEQMGLQAILCPYCRTPIDILKMQLDHKTPLRRGGGPEIENLQAICKPCNGSKGEFTHEEYSALVAFMESAGASFRKRLEGVMRNGGVGNMLRNFARPVSSKKTAKPVEYLEDF